MSKPRLDAYVRVSKVNGRGGDSFYSPEQQRKSIQAWADSHGYEIAQTWTDLDQSGRKASRPEFDKMMQRIERGETGGVVVAKIDRFSRSVTHGLAAIKTIVAADKLFVSVAEGIDPTTRFGKLNMTIVLAMAEWFSDGIKEGWESSLENAVTRGVWPGIAPFGYRKRDDKTLEPDPAEAAHLKAIFERRAAGETWQQIADHLNTEKVKPRRAKQWTGSTVKDITKHEVYLGVVEKQGFRNEQAHEPLVDRHLWTRARNVHKLKPRGSNGSNGRYLLTGLVRCAACGYALAPTTAKRKGKPAVDFYACKARHGSGRCPAPATISTAVIEPYIEREFLRVAAHLSQTAILDSADYAEAEQALLSAEAELTAYVTDTEARQMLGDAVWRAGLRARNEAAEKARNALAEARRQASGIELPDIVTLREIWPTLSTPEKRELIGSALDVVFVRQGRRMPPEAKTRIMAKGEAPAELPRKGVSAPITSYAHIFDLAG